MRVVGNRWSERGHEIKMFLARNHVPYRWYDVERDAEGERLRELAGAGPDDLPLVLVPGGERCARRRAASWPTRWGCTPARQQPLYDVCIVGGGRPGSRPRSTPHRRDWAPSWSSGRHRAARPARARRSRTTWASPEASAAPTSPSGRSPRSRRFGAEMVLARDVVGLERARARARGPARRRRRDRGALGDRGQRRRRTAGSTRPASTELTGRGVYYGATAAEAGQCRGDDVYLVGAANSAGQAALNFARHAKRVVLLVRGTSLLATMSQYLVARIEADPHIEVRYRTEVAGADGDGHLESLTLADRTTGTTERRRGDLAVRVHRR